jgi:hypothetical protein
MGEMVGNGMKNLMDLAEGYIYEDEPAVSDSNDPTDHSHNDTTECDVVRRSDSGSPAPIDSISNHSAATSSASASSFSARSLGYISPRRI